MTANHLVFVIECEASKLTSFDIPVRMNGKSFDVEASLRSDDNGYFIELIPKKE